MTRYLLDTDTLIDFSKGGEPTRSRILQMIDDGDILGVCAINIAEFYSGLPQQDSSRWNDFFGSLAYWEMSREVAAKAGQYRYESARDGQSLTTTDCLIAAVAQNTRATILTSNAKDYQHQDVSVQSLRDT